VKNVALWILVGALLLPPPLAGASGEFFVVGVAPHTSARVILEMYQPLRLYLGKSLGMPVEVVTAPDFDTFARRGLAREYDLAVTTGHQGRLFQEDAGYIPLLTYQSDFQAFALVAVDGPIGQPSDLNGKDVLGLSPTSLVTLWGQHWLRDSRIDANAMKYVSASDSVAQLVVAGDAAAGFTSSANYQKLSPDMRSRLKILAQSAPMAGRVYLLNRRREDLWKKVDDTLWAFAATPEARRYFDANKLGGYRKLRAGELESMEVYADEVRKVISVRQ